MTFKVGDYVVCVSDSEFDSNYNLPKTVVFKVVQVEGNGKYIKLHNDHLGGHLADRFKLVENYSIQEQIITKIKEMESRRVAYG